MQNTIQNFRQSSIVFEKPVALSQNLNILTSSMFSLGLDLFAKINKDLVASTHSFFTHLLILRDLNKIKKSCRCFRRHY